MTKLDELIQELCPDGVKYLPIPELFITRNGYTPSKANNEFWENGTIPWFRMEDLRENGRILTTATQYVSEKAVKGKLFPADSIIIATSATIGEHALIKVPSLANQRFTYLTLKDEFKDCVDMMFVFYYCFRLDEYCKSHLNQGNFASVDMKQFAAFKFPVPPLPVQREIVHILANFKELTAERTPELTARKQQYAYYRDKLLAFGDDVPKDTLENLCDFQYGKGNSIPTALGEYPVYGCNGVIGTTNVFNSIDAPVIGHIGSAGIVNWGKGKHFVTYNGTICKVRPEKMISRYAYHLLCSLHLERFVKGSQPFLSYSDFAEETVAVPPLNIQQRVVSILDRFDTLCTDLSSGLPAEIEARQKQYEYYRDKLLTFTPAD